MAYYNEKHKENTLRYQKKMKEIRFWVKPEEYEIYVSAAEKAGYPSMRQFYFAAIREKVEEINNREKEDL